MTVQKRSENGGNGGKQEKMAKGIGIGIEIKI